MELLFIFEWLDTSTLAGISKAYGGVFAMVQTVHLVSIALLGGMVLVSDLRLLNLLLTSVPVPQVMDTTRKWITIALITVTLSGVYQASAVAIKLYHNSSFWAKMAGFAMGLLFLYVVKWPLLRHGVDSLNPWTVRLVAVASLTIWFSVAATGRWIGFS
ncbi:MAG: hypothetical protein O2780_14265 [Proteobacteria bacterium]|jgi:hypothetical protein|nr:hypothetical protein [Pseudomonadota bacterium]MDA1300766.1 hypothetical protein [Pseudomonadota bacterium]